MDLDFTMAIPTLPAVDKQVEEAAKQKAQAASAAAAAARAREEAEAKAKTAAEAAARAKAEAEAKARAQAAARAKAEAEAKSKAAAETAARAKAEAQRLVTEVRRHVNEERVRSLLPLQLRRPVFGLLGWLYPKADWAPRVFRAKSTLEALARNSV